MLKRIASFTRQHDWFAVGIEVAVVVIGLLLAFQLDRWRDGLAERRQEQTYIKRLIADVETDIPAIEYAIELQALRLELINLLMRVSEDSSAAMEEPMFFLAAVNQAAYTYTPVLTAHTFENLRSTGDLNLILDESVKSLMFDYYGFHESQSQFRSLQLDTEFHHLTLAAGVLSHEQEALIQDSWHLLRPTNAVSVRESEANHETVLAAAKRLQARPELINWLPYVRDMQLEQIDIHSQRLDRAGNVLKALNEYARKIGASSP